MKKQPQKMQLTRESLRWLTDPKADAALEAIAGGFATRPPVCEQTNYISCFTNCG
jgi:hypothetical protein